MSILVIILNSRKLAQYSLSLPIEDVELQFIRSFTFLWRKYFFYFLGPENVEQNLRQKHLALFYSKTIDPGANMHEDKFVEFEKFYQMV